jgi:hypothetical protein
LITHWHRNHFGDGLSGKWRTRFTAQQAAQASLTLADALEKWGYARVSIDGYALRKNVRYSRSLDKDDVPPHAR